ncbi:MAG: hypothetical protein A2V52_06625 [Actinobacteria bacterium RBG_19FT_COMBO_54_7]|uniref:DUF1579 domain-containing protein n=1 Tax=Candidatus Solincola sediminis TaxID=1797199 RepID=A0A1F2WSP2_9ACTN|nr:MAG: hypothetical protein A2Y75_10485 [Candidatus Solincola sediminis]OFW60891.1 MAG: hypothetical protein A2W01_11975 [Candidatus Solincola sediminis]OFW65340.1 MAG: hypothetical protein A2V52_06625 [Actinobacteria bacterium RBG_19FT_COMBO_54_7]
MAQEEIKTEGAIGPDGKRIELPEKAKVLHKLIGEWKMTAVGHMGDQEMKANGAWSVSATAGGFGTTGRQSMLDPEGNPEYLATDLWGYDPASDEYHYFYVDNFAEAHDLSGSLVHPDKMELVYEGRQDGKKYVELAEVDFVNDNEIRVRSSGKVDDEFVWDFDATFAK